MSKLGLAGRPQERMRSQLKIRHGRPRWLPLEMRSGALEQALPNEGLTE